MAFPKADVYDVLETDEGQARAFAKLDTIKEDVIWWSAGADTPQLLADGEVVIGSTYNGRLFSVIEEQDQPVGMLWDAQVFDLDGWIIPVGLPADRLARAKDFVRFATDTQRLADQAKYISYGPARMSSAPLVGQHADLGIEMAPHMPTDSGKRQEHLPLQLRVVGGLPGRPGRQVPGLAGAIARTRETGRIPVRPVPAGGTMPKGYIIAHITVRDPDAYKE